MEDTTEIAEGTFPSDQKTQQYGNLFFLLQSEPRHIAALCRLVTMAEIDALLQTVMFTIYGNQYESREEHLLLTMFQVTLNSGGIGAGIQTLTHFAVCALRPIRYDPRVLFTATCQYPCLPDDDNLHSQRAWPKLPQDSAGRSNQLPD